MLKIYLRLNTTLVFSNADKAISFLESIKITTYMITDNIIDSIIFIIIDLKVHPQNRQTAIIPTHPNIEVRIFVINFLDLKISLTISLA